MPQLAPHHLFFLVMLMYMLYMTFFLYRVPSSGIKLMTGSKYTSKVNLVFY